MPNPSDLVKFLDQVSLGEIIFRLDICISKSRIFELWFNLFSRLIKF